MSDIHPVTKVLLRDKPGSTLVWLPDGDGIYGPMLEVNGIGVTPEMLAALVDGTPHTLHIEKRPWGRMERIVFTSKSESLEEFKRG